MTADCLLQRKNIHLMQNHYAGNKEVSPNDINVNLFM